MDLYVVDVKEEELVTKFLSKDCCNNECHTLIPREMIESTRNNCLEMSKNELDLVILSHIEAGIMSNEKLESVYAKLAGRKKYGQRQDTEVMRHRIQFTFYRVPVCRSFFLFVHACTTKRYENLVRHFHALGVTVRQHGLANKPSTHPKSFKPADIEKAVKFMESIADLMALLLPGRLPKFKDFRIMKLPSSETKSSIYRKYISSLSDDELKMSNCSFRRIWSKYPPHVTVMKPADDLCDVCRGNTISIAQAKGVTDIERAQKLNQFLDHLHRARNQREYYQSWCRNTGPTAVVLSFDFAQTVHYPVSPQQPGTAYFKATKKCGVFGITDEKQKVQYNYMIDEKDDVGKGPNCVVSILHYHLQTYYKDIETLVLFCDNCVGQNKNNTVLSYLQWCLARGLNKTILFNFLLTGHTKFAPDRYFGIFKSKYAVSNIDTYADLLQCVEASSTGGYNKAESAERVVWYEWDSYFKPLYKSLVGITQFHHFIISTDCVKTKKFADSEEVQSFKLLLKPIDPEMPKVIQPAGLSLERQWYIYHNLRSLVSDISKVDLPSKIRKFQEAVKDKVLVSQTLRIGWQ
ncbi:uncharacterized protein LOC118741966 [Rhagoletis pomonella]|uniref:uncharacterized protein LOC118741966 n=1 Tax=Rhagoletis pomonella TaxID=28610 RepID=UPI00177B3FC8|nr:uncharacterized protein LOC118741966 [Rhagoletis pomonella]